MSLGVKAVKKSASSVTISVTVRDSSTNVPITGATVTIFDDTGARVTASGITADDGTVILKYLKCVDPETKTPDACPGVARKAGYQDDDFLTPFPV